MPRQSLTLLASSLLALSVGSTAYAAVSTFEDTPALSSRGYFFPGGTGTGDADYVFQSGGASFKQTFTDYGGGDCCSDGWTYSRLTDTTTSGFTNQFSAYAGSGQGGTPNYGLAFIPYLSPLEASFSAPSLVSGAYFTNTTYAALSMLNGDGPGGFAKKFGGASGNDADFFKLTITGYNGSASTGSVDFYLADYRSANNAQDYIVKDWSFVNLSSLGTVTKLGFTMSSSDNGDFGMNTPAYFAMDTLTTAPVPEPEQAAMLIAGLALLLGVARKRATAAQRQR